MGQVTALFPIYPISDEAGTLSVLSLMPADGQGNSGIKNLVQVTGAAGIGVYHYNLVRKWLF